MLSRSEVLTTPYRHPPDRRATRWVIRATLCVLDPRHGRRRSGRDPAGALRSPLADYAEYDFDPVGRGASLDVNTFIQTHEIAQIGPFAVRPAYRRRIRVVFWLMRVAGAETLTRGYTHYVTDVFEDEEHSPYRFHTRVLGFEPVATHDTGAMDCLHRRITLVLNIEDA